MENIADLYLVYDWLFSLECGSIGWDSTIISSGDRSFQASELAGGSTLGTCVVKTLGTISMFFSGELLASWKLWRDTSYSGCTKLSPSLPIVISARNIVLWNTASIPYPGSTWSKTCSVLGDKKK